jgi:hypothetical protein
MTADDLMAVLAERLKVEGLSLNEQRVAGISVGDMQIGFEEDDEGVWLHVYADVVKDAAALSKECLLSLLRSHNLFNDVPNASFGVSRTGALTLFMRVHLLDSFTADVWMAMFLSFLVSLRDWRAKLAEEGGEPVIADAEPGLAEAPVCPDERFGMLNGICV